MKKQLLLLPAAVMAFLAILPKYSYAQNTGIGTITPGTTLDVGGAITSRESTGAVSSNAITIPANVSLYRITGAATAVVAVTAAAAPNAGQRLIIYNNTTGGYGATLNGFAVANGQAAEFIYSNGGWRTIDNGVGTIGSPATWNTTGNTGTVDGTNNFVGTNDAVPLNFRVGGGKAGRIGITDGNTALGYQSQYFATATGTFNTSLGYQALLSNTAGLYNTAIGYSSLASNTASNNTALGYQSMYNNSTGNFNTAIGFDALLTNTTSTKNTAVGFQALYNNNAIGGSNTAVGVTALSGNSSGNYNTAMGEEALNGNTTASNNTGTGFQALKLNSTGASNTATGYQALLNNTNNFNTATGAFALLTNNGGYGNTATGFQAMYYNYGGINNTATGGAALMGNTNGSGNTANGQSALANNATGNNNTALGYSAGPSGTALNNSTAIGAYAQATASNALVLGSINGVNNAPASTSVGIGTTAPTAALDVVGSGTSNFAARFKNSSVGGAIIADANSGTYIVEFLTAGSLSGYIYNYGSSVGYITSSDIRLKEGIAATHYGLADLLKIDVKDYTYKSDKAHVPQTGFLAQQLYSIYPTAVAKGGEDVTTAPWGVDYGKLTPLLVKSVQELTAKVTLLEAENAALKAQAAKIANLETAMGEMRAELRNVVMMQAAGNKSAKD